MNWLDIVLIIMLVAVAGIEMCRGFGRAVFDALCLYGALYLSNLWASPLAERLHLQEDPVLNLSLIFGFLFIMLGIASLFVSSFVYGATLMHLGMFEGLLGLVSGIGVGFILAHALVHSLELADPAERNYGALVADGKISSEMLTFHTYHSVLETITGTASYRRQLPSYGG